jgi:hypothetical protein
VLIRTWWVGLSVLSANSGTPEAVNVVDVNPELGVANTIPSRPKLVAAQPASSPPRIPIHLRNSGLVFISVSVDACQRRLAGTIRPLTNSDKRQDTAPSAVRASAAKCC